MLKELVSRTRHTVYILMFDLHTMQTSCKNAHFDWMKEGQSERGIINCGEPHMENWCRCNRYRLHLSERVYGYQLSQHRLLMLY